MNQFYYFPSLYVGTVGNLNPSIKLGFKFQLLPRTEGVLNLQYANINRYPASVENIVSS